MKLIMIADAFPPMRTSAAVHMHELALEFNRQGHSVTVIVPTPFNENPLRVDDFNEYRLVSVSTAKTKDVGYFRRTIGEFISPYVIHNRLSSCPIINECFDGIIWYSPTIFFGPLISRLKVRYHCPAYLVLRDMFPDWVVDLGLMKKRLPYYLLKCIEFYQYKVASYIGIQSPGNFKYFDIGSFKQFKSKVELLWTWITPNSLCINCSIDLGKTKLATRTNFVYAGNMGIAQDFDLIMSLVALYRGRSDIGFVFVGRGSEVMRLKDIAAQRDLSNILFFDEINAVEIPGLYAQCNIGIVALDPRHKSNNIPGKFLSYINSGLPVLARLNSGNDLVGIISENQVGASYVGSDVAEFKVVADQLIGTLQKDRNISSRCKNLAETLFLTENAAKQIVKALQLGN